METAWDFVERYYPKYTSSDTIAREGDLTKIVNGENEPGDAASQLLENEFGMTKLDRNDVVALNTVRDALATVREEIYETSIEAFITQANKLSHELALVVAIITDNYMKSIYEQQGDGGYLMALDSITECGKSWIKEFQAEILDEDTEWELVAEKHACSDWEEMVVKYAGRWFLEIKKMNIKVSQ